MSQDPDADDSWFVELEIYLFQIMNKNSTTEGEKNNKNQNGRLTTKRQQNWNWVTDLDEDKDNWWTLRRLNRNNRDHSVGREFLHQQDKIQKGFSLKRSDWEFPLGKLQTLVTLSLLSSSRFCTSPWICNWPLYRCTSTTCHWFSAQVWVQAK